MGRLKSEFGMDLVGAVPAGTCGLCATKHEPENPHNRQSLVYQYKFYDMHGRWPTWDDAMVHCSEEMKQLWTEALQEKGINV